MRYSLRVMSGMLLLLGLSAQGCAIPEAPPAGDAPASAGADEPATSWARDTQEEAGRDTSTTAAHDEESGEIEPLSTTASACGGTLGSFDYCSPECPCEREEGDCDSDADCAGDYVCMRDMGALFGFDAEVDICMEQCPTIGVGTGDYCSPECPCEAGQADCDEDEDCAAGGVCAKNVGASFGYAPDVDVCVDACDPILAGTWDYCSPACPCGGGQGDCDGDDDCAPGYTCAKDVGADYGLDPEMDVCEASAQEITRIEVTPAAVLLTGSGATRTLSARAFDANGRLVETPFTWKTSNGDAVQVDADGTLTATMRLGSSQIVAEADGVSSPPVMVLIAKPAPGAVLVDDEQVVNGPTLLDADAITEPGARYSVTLSGVEPPAAGTIMLAREGAAIGGRVVSASPAGSDVQVVLELVPLRDMFAELVVNESFALVEEDAGAASSSAYGSLATKKRFRCQTKDEAELELELPTTSSFTKELSLEFRYRIKEDDPEGNGLELLLLRGRVDAEMEVEPTIEAEVEASLACQRKLHKLKVPIPGPLGLLFGGVAELGVGFDLEGQVEAAAVVANLSVNAGATLSLGLDCTGGAGCEPVKSFESSAEGSLSMDLPDQVDVRAQVRARPHLFVNTGFGSRWTDFMLELLTFSAGIEASADIATETMQARMPDYASTYKLVASAEVASGKHLEKALQFVSKIIPIPASFALTHEAILGHSPRGAAGQPFEIDDGHEDGHPPHAKPQTADSAGDPVTFTIHLDPASVDFLGRYNVGEVRLFEVEDEGGAIQLIEGVGACGTITGGGGGQATLSCETTFTEEDIGEHEIAVFVRPALWADGMPLLELTEDSRRTLFVDLEPELHNVSLPPPGVVSAINWITSQEVYLDFTDKGQNIERIRLDGYLYPAGYYFDSAEAFVGDSPPFQVPQGTGGILLNIYYSCIYSSYSGFDVLQIRVTLVDELDQESEEVIVGMPIDYTGCESYESEGTSMETGRLEALLR